MKKFTLLLSALAMTAASWAAIPDNAIIIAAGSPGARNHGKFMAVGTDGKLTTVNTIDESSLWVRDFDEVGEVISNVATKGYLYTNDLTLSETPVGLTIVESEVLPGAWGITTSMDATVNDYVFLNALNTRAGIGTWNLDEGSSFYLMDYDADKTVDQVNEEVNNLYNLSKSKGDAINSVNVYMNKSWGGRLYGESNMYSILNAETDEELQEAVKSAKQAAVIYAETSLKDGATLFNVRAQKTVGIFTDSINCPIQRMDQGIDASCLWFAEMVTTDEELVVDGYTFQSFYLRNALTGKYISKDLTNGAAMQVDAKDQAAIINLVMEATGFELIVNNNGKAKQYLNVSNNDGDPKLTYYGWDNDAGAFFEFNKLPGLESGKLPAAIGMGESADYVYSSLTGVEIAVPADYEPSGLGGIKLVSNGMDENFNWTTTTHAEWTPEQLAAITPETKNVDIKYFDSATFEYVTESVEAKVYTLTLPEAITEPANYRLTVEEYTFQATVEGSPAFSNLFGNSFEINEPAEPAELVVTPAAGTYQSITTITIDPNGEGGWSVGASVGEITVTFNGEITTDANGTELKLDGDAIWAYDAFDMETWTGGGWEIPVSFTANGTYVLTISEGFFENMEGAVNPETVVEWVVDSQTGIHEIVSMKINGKAYDLKGRAVVNPTKGLFIIDGKKVIK